MAALMINMRTMKTISIKPMIFILNPIRFLKPYRVNKMITNYLRCYFIKNHFLLSIKRDKRKIIMMLI